MPLPVAVSVTLRLRLHHLLAPVLLVFLLHTLPWHWHDSDSEGPAAGAGHVTVLGGLCQWALAVPVGLHASIHIHIMIGRKKAKSSQEHLDFYNLWDIEDSWLAHWQVPRQCQPEWWPLSRVLVDLVPGLYAPRPDTLEAPLAGPPKRLGTA